MFPYAHTRLVIAALIIFIINCIWVVTAVSININEELDTILTNGVNDKVYSGVAAMAGSLDGRFRYAGAFGRFKYPDDPDDDGIEDAAVELTSRFDLASLSKVIAGTSAVAILYERGYLQLDTRVADILGKDFAQNGKDTMTIRHCLLHNAGFAPDPVPWYWDITFGCPNSDDYNPDEDFSCLDKVYSSLMLESLVTPPGEAFKYSDLSLIALSTVVGTIAMQKALVEKADFSPACISNGTLNYLANVLCHYEAFVAKNVFRFQYSSVQGSSMMPSTQYLVPQASWKSCVPTINVIF
jgi:hypothetical protein